MQKIYVMPTILIIFGFRFYFYSNDHEPIHVHVDYCDAWGRIQIDPNVELIENHGLKQKDIKKALGVASLYREEFIKRWNEHFKNKQNGKD